MAKTNLPSLTDKQALFVEHYVQTGDAAAAARHAGYSANYAKQVGAQALRSVPVQMAIRYQTNIRLQGAGALALNLLERVLIDESVAMGVRVDAAKTILDRAGYSARNVPTSEINQNPVNDMSIDELQNLVKTLENQRAESAKIVTDDAPINAQAIDMLE